MEQHGADPLEKNAIDVTPLHSAARQGHMAVVRYFVAERGISPLVQNRQETLAWAAAHDGRLEMLQLVLETYHVDPSIKDSFGVSPIQIARLARVSKKTTLYCISLSVFLATTAI